MDSLSVDKTKSLARVLGYVPEKKLSSLSKLTNADKNVSKLKGSLLLRLLIYCLAGSEDISQRTLAKIFNEDLLFKALLGDNDVHIVHSAISARMGKIPVDFFRKAFGEIRSKLKPLLESDEVSGLSILRADSTMITDVTGRMHGGMVHANYGHEKGKHMVKVTLSYDQDGPNEVELFTDNAAFNENSTIPQVVRSSKVADKDGVIAVFDRGVSDRKILAGMESFITRIKDKSRYEVQYEMSNTRGRRYGELTMMTDQVVFLWSRGKILKTPFRLIRALDSKKGKKYLLLTNRLDLKAKDVLKIYRKRWDIEVLFRFLKQELDLKNMISLNRNGMEVFIYAILTTAIMVMAIKKKLGMGFKEARQTLIIALQNSAVHLVAVKAQRGASITRTNQCMMNL